jgi:hypothetical protein
MANTSGSPVLTTRFGNLDTFCEELAERRPNVEPIVPICQQVRSGQSDTHGPVPIEYVFGHVTYLRRTADLLHLTVLHLYLGQRWTPADTPARRCGPVSTSSTLAFGTCATAWS